MTHLRAGHQVTGRQGNGQGVLLHGGRTRVARQRDSRHQTLGQGEGREIVKGHRNIIARRFNGNAVVPGYNSKKKSQ